MKTLKLKAAIILLLFLNTSLLYGKNSITNYYIDSAVLKSEFIHNCINNKSNLKVYQLISHGQSGQLFLEGKWRNAQEIVEFLYPKLNPAILFLNIYGCEFAKGDKGQQAVAYLEKTLGVSVSASTNITGKDGDWVLEVGKAKDVMAINDYKGSLQSCPYGSTSDMMYASNSVGNTGGGSTPQGSTGSPDFNYIPVYDTGTAYQTIATYPSTFVAGDYVYITGLWNSASWPGGVVLAFSADNSTYSANSTVINGFNATAYTTVGFQIPASVTGNLKYIRIQGAASNTLLDIDAIGVAIPRCKYNPINGTAFIDNGAGGGTASNCIKDGTESGTIISSGMYAKIKTVGGLSAISAAPLNADGTFTISDVANGTYVVYLDNNNNLTDFTPKNPTDYNGVISQTITVTNGVVSPALNLCLTFKDSDGDGIGDDTDLDDDNDGILDVVENACSTVITPTSASSSTSWSGGPASNTIASIGLTGTGLAAQKGTLTFSNTFLLLDPNTTGWIDYNMASNTSINEVALWATKNPTSWVGGDAPIKEFQVEVTFSGGVWTSGTFSTANPNLATNTSAQIFDLGQTFNNVTKVRLKLLDGWYNVGNDGVTFVSTLGQPNLTYYNMTLAEFRAVNTCTADLDTDGDGIPNRLDLDSDNDGCSDAYESGVTAIAGVSMTTGTSGTVGGVALANSVVVAPYGANGFANSVETAAESGVYKGTYTYANAINSAVHTCPVCNAGTVAPTHGATLNNVCPATTANLSTFATSACPTGSSLEWHTSATVSAATLYASPTAAIAGTYYATCHDATNACYSPASTGVVVTITVCCKAGTVAPTHAATLNNVCPAQTVNLATASPSTCPTGSSLEWHTSATVSTATLYATPTAATAGTYYATCHDATNACYSPASTGVVVTINPLPSSPTIGTITQPTCATATGSVILNGLPATGTWTIASNPAGYSATGTGTSTTISNLPAGTYTFTVTNANGCTSVASANVVINAQPATPTAPTIGTITQPTCTTATGSVILNGLPAIGTWTIVSTPTGYGASSTGTSTTISNLPTGSYTFTVTNASTCTSVASTSVVINAQPATPTAPTIGTITQPTCNIATGSVVLSGLPAAGTWTIVSSPTGYGATGTGTSTTISNLPAGNSYTFTVTNASGCTSVASTSAVIIAQPANPTPPVLSPATICTGNSTVLTASTNCTNSAVLIWYSDAGLTTLLGSTTVSPPSTTTYYATCVLGSCKSTTASVIISVVTPPSAPSATPSSICSGGTATLSATCSVGTLTWYSDSGLSLVISNTPTALITTTYYGACLTANCKSAGTPLTVTVGTMSAPTSLSASKTSICSGSTNLTGTCATGLLVWYPDNTFTTALSSATVSPTSTSSYYASCESGACVIHNTTPVVITVTACPVLSNDAATYTPGSTATINLVSNDSNVDASTITLSGTGTLSADGKSLVVAGEGTWTVNSSGVLTFTPLGTFTGSPTPISYTAKNASGAPATTPATVTLTALPVLTNDASTYTPGSTATINLVSNDSNVDASTITLSGTGTLSADGKSLVVAGEGTWTVNSSGVLTFTPLGTFTGSPTPISYTAKNASGTPATTPATITLTALPVLTNDASTYTPGSTATINLVSNDSNVDASTITLSGTGTLSADGKSLVVAGEGTWTVNSSGVLTFTPLGTFTGSPTPISYTAKNASGTPATTPATITLTALPVLTNDASTYTPGSTATINLVSNDSNVDASTITLSGTGTLSADGKSLVVAGEGTWTVNSSGVLTFTPLGTFTGSPTPISYTAKNASGTPATTPATITLTALPVLSNDAATYTPGSTATINLVSNDSNVDASTITLSGTGTLSADGKSLVVAGEGTWTVNSSGVLTFTPLGTFTGSPTPISYTAKNASGTPATTPATITLTALPVLTNDASTYTPGSTATINLVSNDSNVDASTITLSGTGTLSADGKSLVVAGEGTWTVNSSGVLTFTPLGTFTGSPTPISYTAKNASGTPATTPATITLTALPVLTNDASTYTPGSTATINLVSNDSNVDASTITLSGTGTLSADGKSLVVAGEGTWTVNSSGVLTFTPLGTFTGSPTPISYTAKNASGTPATTPATITLTALPVLTNDASTYTPGSTATINLVSNDSNVDASTITLSGTGTLSADGKSLVVAGEGTWTVNSSGVLTFTPFGTFTGTPTPISYNAKNTSGTAAATPGTVTLVPAPTASNDTGILLPNSSVTVNVLNNDANTIANTVKIIDPTTGLSVSTLTVPGGHWDVNADGTITFTQTDATKGLPTPITYSVANATGTTTTATVTLTTAPNPGPLNVTLINFEALKEANTIILTWTTAEEINADRFEVLRSIDAKVFESIGMVRAKGNSQSNVNYSLTDTNPVQGVNYYRLKSIDFDGSVQLSNIIQVRVAYKAALGPNPIVSGSFSIFDLNIKNITITNINNQSIDFSAIPSQNGVNIKINENLQPGVYILKYLDQNSNSITHKIIVN